MSRLSVFPGQIQGGFDKAQHFIRGSLNAVGSALGRSIGLPGLDDFQCALNDREWGAQLVARRSCEELLSLDKFVEPIEVAIEFFGDRTDLAAFKILADMLLTLIRPDRRQTSGQVLHRFQYGPGTDHAHYQGEDQYQQHAPAQNRQNRMLLVFPVGYVIEQHHSLAFVQSHFDLVVMGVGINTVMGTDRQLCQFGRKAFNLGAAQELPALHQGWLRTLVAMAQYILQLFAHDVAEGNFFQIVLDCDQDKGEQKTTDRDNAYGCQDETGLQ